MAKSVQIAKISENDSQEQRISKLNSNFQNLLAAAMKLDRTGILVGRSKKKTDASIESLSDDIEAESARISDLEGEIGGVKTRLGADEQRISALEQNQGYDASFSETGWSYRKWPDGSVELWGRATGACLPGRETTLSNDLPFELSSVISWQASLRKTTVENIFLERSSVESGQFLAIVENESPSVAILVVNAYIIGMYQKDGE